MYRPVPRRPNHGCAQTANRTRARNWPEEACGHSFRGSSGTARACAAGFALDARSHTPPPRSVATTAGASTSAPRRRRWSAHPPHDSPTTMRRQEASEVSGIIGASGTSRSRTRPQGEKNCTTAASPFSPTTGHSHEKNLCGHVMALAAAHTCHSQDCNLTYSWQPCTVLTR